MNEEGEGGGGEVDVHEAEDRLRASVHVLVVHLYTNIKVLLFYS